MGRNVVIFASGSGSNAENIIRHFNSSDQAHVKAVFCNNPYAYVIERAERLHVPVILFNRDELYHNGKVLQELEHFQPDLIVLAGFLWLIPHSLIKAYPNRIINIHPALLPKYGGKGMYGDKVHQAVIAAGEKESGITIHRVDEHYDEGDIIFQAHTAITEDESPQSLAEKIHALEHRHFPVVIQEYLQNLN